MEMKPTTMTELLEKDGVLPNTPSENKEKPYTLRKLSARDISPMVKIIKKVDLNRIKDIFTSEDVQKLIEEVRNKKDEKDEKEASNQILTVVDENEKNEENTSELMRLGGNILIEMIPMLLDALDNAIDDVNTLLANVANMEKEDVENMELDTYFMLVYDFLNKEEFAGFLKVVSRFTNMDK